MVYTKPFASIKKLKGALRYPWKSLVRHPVGKTERGELELLLALRHGLEFKGPQELGDGRGQSGADAALGVTFLWSHLGDLNLTSKGPEGFQ